MSTEITLRLRDRWPIGKLARIIDILPSSAWHEMKRELIGEIVILQNRQFKLTIPKMIEGPTGIRKIREMIGCAYIICELISDPDNNYT